MHSLSCSILLALGASRASPLSSRLTVGCESGLKLSGGATITAAPVLCIRSGTPKTISRVTLNAGLLPGSKVTSLSFAYEYLGGYGPTGAGTVFTVSLINNATDAEHLLYTSPPLVNYSYNKNRSGYSPPIKVELSSLAISIDATHNTVTQLQLKFQNNARNVQLKIPFSFVLGCDASGGGAGSSSSCLAMGAWSPPSLTSVFAPGDDVDGNKGPPCFRIPAVAVAPISGDLLAFAEGRYHGCNPDVYPTTTLVMRRSLDGGVGKEWGNITTAAAFHGIGLNYPSPLVDKKRKKIHLFFAASGVKGDCSWHSLSADDGKTWTTPQNASAMAGFSMVIAGGGGGVQLRESSKPGRLVFACHGNGTTAHPAPGGGVGRAACYSDDGGATWKRGENVPVVTTPSSALSPHGLGESAITIDASGGVDGIAMLCRVGTRDGLVTHALARSQDGGETWSTRATALPPMRGPTCQGSIGQGPNGTLLLSAPLSNDGSLNGRENLALFSVAPNDAPGFATQIGTLWGCKAAYSHFDPSGTLNLFENGESFRYGEISLAHLDGDYQE